MLIFTLVVVAAAVAPCDRLKPLPKRAECERKAGHLLKALELVEQHLVKKKKDKKALKLRDALEAEVVVVQWFSEPEGALVSVDGADPAGSTPIKVRLDPGPHRFHFTFDGYAPLDRTEQAIASTKPNLTAVLDKIRVELPPEAESPAAQAVVTEATAAPADAVVVTEPEPARAPSPASHSNAPYIVGGTGVVIAIGGGVLTFASFLSQQSGTDRGAELRQYVGFGLIGVGVALGVAAVVWLLVDRPPGVSVASRPAGEEGHQQ